MSNYVSNLKKYKSKTITAICPNEFVNKSHNHCAHFVSHVMEYTFGFKCKDMTGKGDGKGANIRVQEIFRKCGTVGLWNDRPKGDCLAFITSKKNVDLIAQIMTNVPKKHIGIFYEGKIHHYSNSKNRVVEQTPEDFSKHYSGSDITVYYGTFPASST